MRKFPVVLIILLFFLNKEASGQDTDPGPGYQAVLMNNPALAGSEGTGKMRISYLNFFPGNGYNLHSLYLSYDSYFQALHGGAAVYLSEDYLGGIVNDIRGGVSYSYFIQAGKDLFISAGLSASLFHRGFNFGGSVLPDQIDPLGGVVYPTAETLRDNGRTVFDMNTGLTISGKLFSGGIGVMHLSEPNLSSSPGEKEIIKRKMLLHICGDFALAQNSEYYLRPIAFIASREKFIVSGAGLSAENEHVTLNVVCMGNNSGNIDLQTGFSVKAGFARLFYTYRFNVVSGNDLLPLSLMHQTGLVFSLNDVDKRKSIKTINFPKL